MPGETAPPVTSSFGVDTGFVGHLSSRVAAEESDSSHANNALKSIYTQVHADRGDSFDTPQHWAQVNNELSKVSSALDGVVHAVKNLAESLSKVETGYQESEDKIQGAYQKALSKLPEFKSR